MEASSSTGGLGDRDLEQLRRRGIAVEEIERQLALLRDPPPPLEVVAPATVDNGGIERIDPGAEEGRIELWAEAAREGRLSKLVPASGAASRMFASLSRALASGGDLRLAPVRARAAAGDADARDLERLASGLERLPFRDALAGALRAEGTGGAADPLSRVAAGDPDADLRPLLAALLEPGGLGFAGLAKGLIPFHRRSGRAVTPVEEHLAEAALLVRDAAGRARVHFTVPEGAQDAFREAAARARVESGEIELELSTQSPATDTVALDADRRPFRTPEGELLFRPGGHGALLRNLEELGADLVLVKNIDNVQPEERRGASIRCQRLLAGLLVELQHEIAELLDRLEDARDLTAAGDARAFVARWLAPRGDEPLAAGAGAELDRGEPMADASRGAGDRDESARRELAARLDRPLRVAGMVPVSGEPGGGPFWARGRDGATTRQIVETAEIAQTRAQQAVLEASTHFNPVLMALGVRDRHGRPYRLRDFVDPTRPFLTERTAGGRKLIALEHPGLWNGSMAGWNTVFIEISAQAFSPVKTVLDLLRPEHQTGAGASGAASR